MSQKSFKLLRLSPPCPPTPTQQQSLPLPLPPAETGTFPHLPSSTLTHTLRNFQNTPEDSRPIPDHSSPNTSLPITGSRLTAFRPPIPRRRVAAFRPQAQPYADPSSMKGFDGESTSVAGESSRGETSTGRPAGALLTAFREEDLRLLWATSLLVLRDMASGFDGKWSF
ncbi:hypothetical protein ACFXTN_021144 [Malus domestica]